MGCWRPITPELHRRGSEDTLWDALAELDRYRQRFDGMPAGLTNSILLGTLLVPLGLMPRRQDVESPWESDADDEMDARRRR